MPNTILIADDDPQIRKLCRLTLQQAGYVVREATNGKDALAAVGITHFDLVLLDVSMPGMDGLEFLKAVRLELPQLKIVVMSGFIGGTMLPAAKLMGGTATLAKPFSPDALLSIVDGVLAGANP